MWGAGFVVAVAILFLWNKGEKSESITIFKNLDGSAYGSKVSNNIVNELLLSANDFNIYGKSTLIEYNTRANESLLQQIKANPGNAYQNILKNKLDKLKQPQTSGEGFNVKPVPQ